MQILPTLKKINLKIFGVYIAKIWSSLYLTQIAQWLGRRTANWKVGGTIPHAVVVTFLVFQFKFCRDLFFIKKENLLYLP